MDSLPVEEEASGGPLKALLLSCQFAGKKKVFLLFNEMCFGLAYVYLRLISTVLSGYTDGRGDRVLKSF